MTNAKKIIWLFFSFFILITGKIFSQCSVTASVDQTEICLGDCVTLSASNEGCPTYLMSNDFNNGTIGTGGPYYAFLEGGQAFVKTIKLDKNGSYTWLCIFKDIFGKAHQETGKITLNR